MDYIVEQLNKEDYEEAMDFINMVFSMQYIPINFPEYLPVYYKNTQEHMKCHYVIRCGGKIRALVGIYPGELLVGKEQLKIARIGVVSTHPSYRDMGLMKHLMGYCMELVKSQGYDAACLSGLRNRYMNYNFEKCGNRIMYMLNISNLKGRNEDLTTVSVKPIPKDSEISIEKLKKYYDKQIVRFKRSKENFLDICANWNHRIFAGYINDELLGYLITDKDSNCIYEAAGKDTSSIALILQKFFLDSGKKNISIEVNPSESSVLHKFGLLCEEVEIKDVDNWRIFNWEKVLRSLLIVKNMYTPLAMGKVVVKIENQGSIKIEKGQLDILCTSTDETADIIMEETKAARVFFGPMQPYQIVELPAAAQILNSWCPLPLYASKQDFS